MPISAHYDALVAAGALERDDAQLGAIEKLDALLRQIEQSRSPKPLASAFALLARAGFSRRPPCGPAPRGLYLWGLVGRGKTTLMDLFFDALRIEKKRRAHFHAFMADVHARLHHARRASACDPVARVAADIAGETRVLCFDEFAVTDIADATILSRLFTGLLAKGVVVIATSNVEPRRLYEGGRNRDLFLPFLALLEDRLDILRLDARTDFRLEKHALREVYLTPAGERSRHAIDALFLALTGAAHGEPTAIELMSRRIEIPEAAGGVARFPFADLCARPLGAADYAALASAFDTIIIENVPKMNFDRRNEAKRFITLVDVLYEKKTHLVLSAETEAHQLYDVSTGHEAQEFLRTASRLIEMRSQEYLQKAGDRFRASGRADVFKTGLEKVS